MLKKFNLISIFILLFLVFSNGCFSNSSGGKVGEKAPKISAKKLNEEKLTLEKDKITVLVFFENGCAACIKELPLLDEFAYEQRDKLQAIAINSVDEFKAIQEFKNKYKLENITFGKDDLDISWQRYSIFALPTTIIIKDSVVIERITGDKPWQDLQSKLLSFL